MKLPITNRLRCCASLISEGARVVDVGCDHGYLGVYLLLEHRAVSVIASDVREMPLASARRNAEKYGVACRMSFRLSDGLSAIEPGQVDTIVCAGMGGDLIARILDDCPWLMKKGLTLVLQPQSAARSLRVFLAEHNYELDTELPVRDGRFLYTVMRATRGICVPPSPGQQFVSPALLNSGSPLVGAYLARIIQRLERTVGGISRGKKEHDELPFYRTALEEVLNMRDEYENHR